MANIKPLYENFKGDIYKKFCSSRDFISRLSELLFLNGAILDKKFQEEKNNFFIKYSNQISLKRFSIGIFGKISSGKSTFLNYLLGLKGVLQVQSEVATKFVCFIRHNKHNKVPRFYEAIPENRKLYKMKNDFFNFEKGNEIVGNINEVISQRNKEIIDTEKNDEIIQEALKYFIIIEANLTIFNDPILEKYADIFEFLDIPGLDEGQFKDNPNLRNLITIIVPNLAFSIFIFNGDAMQDTPTAIIVKEITTYFSKNEIFDKSISNEIDKKITLNSLYIINKVDNENDYDEQKNLLKKELEEIFKSENYTFNVNDLNVIPLSGRNLLFEANQFEDFYYFLGNTYVKYKKLNEKTRKEFKSYLSDELKPFSKTEKVKKEDDSSDSDRSDDNDEDDGNNELKNISENEKKRINELIDDIKKISNDFSIPEYIKYKKKFSPKNQKEKVINPSNELYKIFNKIMEKIVGEFIKTDEFENSYQYLMKSKEKNKLILLSEKIKQNYNCIIDPIKTINELESNYKEGLIKIDIKTGKDILELTEIRKKIFDIQKNLNFLLFGKSNSGKSTFINSVIIGEDILPTSNRECTKIGIILKNCDDLEESSLYKVKLISKKFKNEENENIYFDYNEKDLIVKGITNIKTKLIELNQLTKEDSLDFYLVKIPLKLYEFIDNEEIRNLRNIIHLIDFPGLDTITMEKVGNIKNLLFKIIHGFLFLNRNEISTMNDSSTYDLLEGLLRDIRTRNLFGFSFKSCLFVMISEENKDVSNFRKGLNICINKSQKQIPFNEILKNYNLAIKNKDIQIIKFSNIYFREYLESYEFLTNENIFYGELKKQESKEELTNFYEKNLKSKIKLPKNFELPKENEDIIQKIMNNTSEKISEKDRNKLSKKIAKYYFYIINNSNNLICYENSGFNEMKNYLTLIFLHSNQFYQDSLKKSCAKHFLELSQIFNEIENAINVEEQYIDRDYFEKNKDIELNKLEKLKNRMEKEIEKQFQHLEYQIMECLSSLYGNKKDYRNDFAKKEQKKIKEANDLYFKGITEINRKIKIMYDKCDSQIKYIKSKTQKKTPLNQEFQQNYLEEEKLDLTAYVENNFLYKAFNNPTVLVLNCIPFVNFFSYGASLISGFFDHFADHSEEFEREIKRIENEFKSKIKSDCYKAIKKVNSFTKNYGNKINCLFDIIVKDLKKIKNNREQLIKILNDFENYLLQLLLSNS